MWVCGCVCMGGLIRIHRCVCMCVCCMGLVWICIWMLSSGTVVQLLHGLL